MDTYYAKRKSVSIFSVYLFFREAPSMSCASHWPQEAWFSFPKAAVLSLVHSLFYVWLLLFGNRKSFIQVNPKEKQRKPEGGFPRALLEVTEQLAASWHDRYTGQCRFSNKQGDMYENWWQEEAVVSLGWQILTMVTPWYHLFYSNSWA